MDTEFVPPPIKEYESEAAELIHLINCSRKVENAKIAAKERHEFDHIFETIIKMVNIR